MNENPCLACGGDGVKCQFGDHGGELCGDCTERCGVCPVCKGEGVAKEKPMNEEKIKRYDGAIRENGHWLERQVCFSGHVTALESELTRLREENKSLRKDASQVFIEELVCRDGGFEAVMTSGIGPVFAEYVKAMMEAQGGENFASFRMSFNDDKGKEYYIIAGRADGKSIQERYGEIREENEKMKSRLKNGRDYLMQCGVGCNDSEALDAFGFGRDGLVT